MAASSFYNRVKYTPVAGGTADFATSAAVSGFRTPATAGIPNGTLVSYVAFSSDQSEWETGQGAYTVATTTVARTTIRESSNAGAKVNFTAAPTVALDLQAQDVALLAPLASPTFTGTVTVPTPFTLGAVSVTATGTQLNFLNAATGTTGTTTTNLVFSTSPTLVTPTLGVAAATSLAIAGATIGTDKLAVTGTANISGVATTGGLINPTFQTNGTSYFLLKAPLIYFNNFSGATMKSSLDGILCLANTAETDFGRLQLGGTTSAFGAIARDGAGVQVVAADGTTGAFLSGVEQTAPAAPAANGYRVFSQDNGAGKTQLMVIFSSGAAQQIAIQP